jgi:S1-C subfamily serine protease
MTYRVVCSATLLILVLLVSIALGSENDPGIETKVVRVFSTKASAYYHKPWKSPNFNDVKASGFFFEPEGNFSGMAGLILTNAHAVSMAESIKVSNGREKRRYDVKCIGICDSADFAVLQMLPEEWEVYERRNGKVKALKLGDSDALRVGDKVMGWGYPLGGERISKSEEGEINRIEVNRYSYSQERWLMVQTSLQQNRGNSGGPVIKDGKVVGISFQGIRDSDRINYFIPINLVKGIVPVIHNQERIPQWRYAVQHMFPRLKEYYGLDQDQGGVLLDYIIPDGGPYTFGLRTDDILQEIDGHEIDNFGEIFFQPLGQKVAFAEVLNRKKVGDPLTIKARRAGKQLTINGTVTPGLPRLVPKIFTQANYFIFGGIGFVELTYNCIENLGKSGESFREKYLDEYPKRPYEKVVVVSEIFPEYGLVETTPYLVRVEKINGEKVLNLEHLYETVLRLKNQGAKKALLELHKNIRLPLDIAHAEKMDRELQDKYGVLYMKTSGGFRK